MRTSHRRVARFAALTSCLILAIATPLSPASAIERLPATTPPAGDGPLIGPNAQNWRPPLNPLTSRRTPSPEKAEAFTGANVPLGSPNEPHVAVDPNNSMHVAVASYYLLRISTDGGATFGPGINATLPSGYVSDGDVSLGYDSQGRLFWSYLGEGPNGVDAFVGLGFEMDFVG